MPDVTNHPWLRQDEVCVCTCEECLDFGPHHCISSHCFAQNPQPKENQ